MYFRLPSVITQQGKRAHDLSKKWHNLWLATIHRENFGQEKYPYVHVCSRHFITGELL